MYNIFAMRCIINVCSYIIFTNISFYKIYVLSKTQFCLPIKHILYNLYKMFLYELWLYIGCMLWKNEF